HEEPVIEADWIPNLRHLGEPSRGKAEAIPAVPIPARGCARVVTGRRGVQQENGHIVLADNTSHRARIRAIQVGGQDDRLSHGPHAEGGYAVPVSRHKSQVSIELLLAKSRYAVRRGDDKPPADQGRGTHKGAGIDSEEQLSRRPIGVVYIGGKLAQI